MKLKTKIYVLGFALLASFYGYFVSCTHENTTLPEGSGGGGPIERGTQEVTLQDPSTTFDKVHSNVNWSTAYLGEISILTGRFNFFGFNSFNFEESNPDSIYFEAYVYLNSVNTSEPQRDQGCLLTTFGTSAGAGYVDSNLAIIKTTKVEYSTTDKGYIVTANLTFHGFTNEVTGKLDYVGVADEGTYNEYGFNFAFTFQAISDFGITATNVGDNISIVCGAAFKHAL